MQAFLEATDLVVGDPALPVSFVLQRGEILGLLFPPGRARAPLLRVLAGMSQPRAGALSYSGGNQPRAAIALGGWPRGFQPQAELVLIDGLLEATKDAALETWAQLASEREQGTSIIVATSSEVQAYRTDRVSLAMWSCDEAMRAARKVHDDLHAMVAEFLRLTRRGRAAPNAGIAMQLRCLARAAEDLLAESRKTACDVVQERSVKQIASELTRDPLDAQVLDALLAKEDGAKQDCE
jgi:hypothetical protein